MSNFPELIFFIHVPKTAGTSFRNAAEQRFSGRVLLDYGRNNPATSEAIIQHVYERPDRIALARLIAERNIGMICGHVDYQTYAHLAPPERVVVFLREPVQRVVSEFHHFRRFYGYEGSLMEYARHSLQLNRQSRMVKGLNLARAGLVGLSEYYGESLRLLARRTGLELSHLEVNTNPERLGTPRYQVLEEEDAELRELNAEDVLLYRRASEAFRCATGTAGAAHPLGAVHGARDSVEETMLLGSVDGFEKSRLFGWAMQLGVARPVLLDVFVGDEFVRTVTADRYRLDLHKKGVHPTGCAGFAVVLGELAPGTVIRCRLHGTDRELQKSPLVVDEASS
ncbi:MAG TPA: hypothetical protein VGJ84_24465 [Polyangiaceae bacterium]